MELGSDRARREDRLLAEIAEKFPGMEAKRVPGVGWEVYPKGTLILRCDDLDILVGKLEKQRERPR